MALKLITFLLSVFYVSSCSSFNFFSDPKKEKQEQLRKAQIQRNQLLSDLAKKSKHKIKKGKNEYSHIEGLYILNHNSMVEIKSSLGYPRPMFIEKRDKKSVIFLANPKKQRQPFKTLKLKQNTQKKLTLNPVFYNTENGDLLKIKSSDKINSIEELKKGDIIFSFEKIK